MALPNTKQVVAENTALCETVTPCEQHLPVHFRLPNLWSKIPGLEREHFCTLAVHIAYTRGGRIIQIRVPSVVFMTSLLDREGANPLKKSVHQLNRIMTHA